MVPLNDVVAGVSVLLVPETLGQDPRPGLKMNKEQGGERREQHIRVQGVIRKTDEEMEGVDWMGKKRLGLG